MMLPTDMQNACQVTNVTPLNSQHPIIELRVSCVDELNRSLKTVTLQIAANHDCQRFLPFGHGYCIVVNSSATCSSIANSMTAQIPRCQGVMRYAVKRSLPRYKPDNLIWRTCIMKFAASHTAESRH